MKQFVRGTWPRFACWAIAVATTLSAFEANAQQEISKSEIVTITDADKEFFDTVDRLRNEVEGVAEATPSFREAEEIAKRLASDPLNDQLKKEMIGARSIVLKEKIDKLRELANKEGRLESDYFNHKKQLDAQMAESVAAVDREESAEVGEADFLTEALMELKQLDALLPRGDNSTLVSTDVKEAIQLSADQHETIRKFKQQLHAAELQMKLAQESVDLHQRQRALLGLARVKATEDYLDLKMAIASSKADQAIFGAIARNDLVALKVISQQERLNSILSRDPPKYESPSASGMLQEGFQFGALPSQDNSAQSDSADDNQELINRYEKSLGDRKAKLTKPGTVVSNTPTSTQDEKENVK